MGILKQVPEVSLGGGAATGAEILLHLALVSGLGQQPPRDSGDHDQSVTLSLYHHDNMCYDIMTLCALTSCVMTSCHYVLCVMTS